MEIKMQVTREFWIVFERTGITRFRKTKPAIKGNELTTKIRFTYDTQLFEKPQFQANVDLNQHETLNVDITQLEHQIAELKTKNK